MAGTAARESVKTACKRARPIMSIDNAEAHRRVLGLYRAFYRYIPYIVKCHDIPKNEENCRCKLREFFYKNAHISDIRVIDLLVMKGYMELKEIDHQWQQKGHLMANWKPSYEPQPNDFVGKFIAGID